VGRTRCFVLSGDLQGNGRTPEAALAGGLEGLPDVIAPSPQHDLAARKVPHERLSTQTWPFPFPFDVFRVFCPPHTMSNASAVPMLYAGKGAG